MTRDREHTGIDLWPCGIELACLAIASRVDLDWERACSGMTLLGNDLPSLGMTLPGNDLQGRPWPRSGFPGGNFLEQFSWRVYSRSRIGFPGGTSRDRFSRRYFPGEVFLVEVFREGLLLVPDYFRHIPRNCSNPYVIHIHLCAGGWYFLFVMTWPDIATEF